MKVVLGIVGAIVLIVAAFLGYQYYRLQQAATQWDSAKEIVSESIEREGDVWKVRMVSIIDHPVDRVWEAIQQPELLSERVDAFKKSKLKKEEGNKKVIEMGVQVLTLPLQSSVVEFTYDQENRQVKMVTLASATSDVTSTYVLEPSPDGQKTRMVYDATARQKVAVPLPENVQRGALKELFVKTIRAIEAGIENPPPTPGAETPAPEAPEATPESPEGTPTPDAPSEAGDDVPAAT